jgi:hypothetical protein
MATSTGVGDEEQKSILLKDLSPGLGQPNQSEVTDDGTKDVYYGRNMRDPSSSTKKIKKNKQPDFIPDVNKRIANMQSLAVQSALLSGFTASIAFDTSFNEDDFSHASLGFIFIALLIGVLVMNLYTLVVNTISPYFAVRILAYSGSTLETHRLLCDTGPIRSLSVYSYYGSFPLILLALMIKLSSQLSSNLTIVSSICLSFGICLLIYVVYSLHCIMIETLSRIDTEKTAKEELKRKLDEAISSSTKRPTTQTHDIVNNDEHNSEAEQSNDLVSVSNTFAGASCLKANDVVGAAIGCDDNKDDGIVGTNGGGDEFKKWWQKQCGGDPPFDSIIEEMKKEKLFIVSRSAASMMQAIVRKPHHEPLDYLNIGRLEFDNMFKNAFQEMCDIAKCELVDPKLKGAMQDGICTLLFNKVKTSQQITEMFQNSEGFNSKLMGEAVTNLVSVIASCTEELIKKGNAWSLPRMYTHIYCCLFVFLVCCFLCFSLFFFFLTFYSIVLVS